MLPIISCENLTVTCRTKKVHARIKAEQVLCRTQAIVNENVQMERRCMLPLLNSSKTLIKNEPTNDIRGAVTNGKNEPVISRYAYCTDEIIF